ncbi:MAG: hypothetical protein ACFFG0_01285 [Candidatus Thorarchaeota archaeon]
MPAGQEKGKGQGQSRGQGKGSMGKPKGVNEMDKVKEAVELVDIILTGDYKQFKSIKESHDLTDEIIDEIENKIDHVPDQDIPSLHKSVADELSKDSMAPVEEAILQSVRNLLKEEDYKEFFAAKLKKWNVNSPSELSDEKKKEFFDQVDKEWKAKKETD